MKRGYWDHFCRGRVWGFLLRYPEPRKWHVWDQTPPWRWCSLPRYIWTHFLEMMWVALQEPGRIEYRPIKLKTTFSQNSGSTYIIRLSAELHSTLWFTLLTLQSDWVAYYTPIAYITLLYRASEQSCKVWRKWRKHDRRIASKQFPSFNLWEKNEKPTGFHDICGHPWKIHEWVDQTTQPSSITSSKLQMILNFSIIHWFDSIL